MSQLTTDFCVVFPALFLSLLPFSSLSLFFLFARVYIFGWWANWQLTDSATRRKVTVVTRVSTWSQAFEYMYNDICMYIYVYIYTYVYIYVYICICIYVYIYIWLVSRLASDWHCNALQRAATRCSALQRAATRCNALQRAATRCNIIWALVIVVTHFKCVKWSIWIHVS